MSILYQSSKDYLIAINNLGLVPLIFSFAERSGDTHTGDIWGGYVQ